MVIDDVSGAANVWANGGPANGGWLWTPKGQIATGLGAGAGVRFADIGRWPTATSWQPHHID